jgi:hypothetical protein
VSIRLRIYAILRLTSVYHAREVIRRREMARSVHAVGIWDVVRHG